MMAQRHLRQLLREKQEPFVLQSFIEERRGQLRLSSMLKKQVPLSKSPTFSSNPSQSPSFIPTHPKRSPVFDLTVKSPSFGLKPVAYLILDAALRVEEKQRKSKRGNSIKGLSFGFFGSILKRFALRKRGREIDGEEMKVSVKDILGWDSSYPRIRRRKFQVANRPGNSSFRGKVDELEKNEFRAMTSSNLQGRCSLVDVKDMLCLASSPACYPGSRKPEVFGGTRPERKEQGEVEHEEKEPQLSPVSVLDPSFAEEDEEDHHPELSNAKSTRQAGRLERLAASLLPIELDQLLALEQDDEIEDMKLIADITDEERQLLLLKPCKLDDRGLLERVCKRVEAWKEAGHCTIDMMVELDFRRDSEMWKRCEEQVPEIATGIEISIFDLLVYELFDELVF
ncbi:hypothetical protein DsansV1_C18g0149241 [Dioscorea sansibarensis]